MKSTILCITDFTESSKQVVKQACQLAKQLHYHLTILYCYRLSASPHGLTQDSKKLKEKKALEEFTALESEFIKGFGIAYDFRSEVGFLINRVEDHVIKEDIRFLIVDKKMKTDNLEIFNELLERSSVPIVLITSRDMIKDYVQTELTEAAQDLVREP